MIKLLSSQNKVRIEQAARMLVETDLTCEQAGWDCGFTSYHPRSAKRLASSS